MASHISGLPKILIITTVHWPATTRLGLALAKSGFAVGAVAPGHHGLHKLAALTARFICQPHLGLRGAVGGAIEQWTPDLVVPGDDRALSVLHGLHAGALAGRGRAPQRMKALIEASLGNPGGFDILARKSKFVQLAKAEGLAVPDTVVVRDLGDLRRRLAGAAFPQVLKVDGTWGGLGVRIVRNTAEAEQAFVDLAERPSWPRIAKQVLQHFNFTPLGDRLYHRRPTVTLQAFIDGRPANRAVVCWQGEVLAGLSVEVMQCDGATGPASVVRVIDHPEMADATKHLVQRLGLSGFCGVDFILDATGCAHLLELNARATTLCYLALDAQSDMTGALLAQLTRTTRRELAPVRRDLIAFFPHELWRDPNSRFLTEAYHDVPWQDPDLIAAYLRPDRPGWIDQLRQMVRRPRPLVEPVADLGDLDVAADRPGST